MNAPRRPNVLVVMSDQQKATASHLWGSPWCRTPALEGLADTGVLFDCAITPHPLCAPARQSFWTGQWPHSHGGRRNETLLAPGTVHAFGLWKAAGYRTGLIGKNHCFADPADLAMFDVWCEITHGNRRTDASRGMEWFRPARQIDAVRAAVGAVQPQNPRFAYGITDLPLEDHATGLVAGQTERFLEAHAAGGGDEPFALWVSFPDPHEPWVCPRSYAERFPPEAVELPPRHPDEFDDPATVPERNRVLARMLGVGDDGLEDVKRLVGIYHGMVRFVDDGLGQILAALDRLQLREDTIVVYCSDHGDFMGEHGMQCKGGVFYDCLTRVPLVVSWPGHVAAGLRRPDPVNLVDVVPTLLHLQGLPVPASMHGEPLPGVTAAPPREATFSEYGAGGPPFTLADLERLPRPHGRRTLIESLRWREAEGRRKMVRTRDWKYVHDPMGDLDELYDLRADPHELTNVAADPAHGPVRADLARRLADWSVRTEDARPVALP